MNTDNLHQAESIARLIMFADELGHEMADDLNIAFSVVDDLLHLAIKDNPNIHKLKEASVIASQLLPRSMVTANGMTLLKLVALWPG